MRDESRKFFICIKNKLKVSLSWIKVLFEFSNSGYFKNEVSARFDFQIHINILI